LHFHNGDYFGGFAGGNVERLSQVAVVQVNSPRVSFRKLITAAAGTDGMSSPGAFDLLVGIFLRSAFTKL